MTGCPLKVHVLGSRTFGCKQQNFATNQETGCCFSLKNAILCAMTIDDPAPMSFTNPSPDEICNLLHRIRSIAVMGLSPNPERPSFRVAQAMQSHGYQIVPVRPLVRDVLGETAYADLESIPFKVDMVDVFRAPEHVPAIVESCIALGIKHLWLQDGVTHQEAAHRAQAAGITVIMNRCVWRDYSQLCNKS